MFTSTDIILSNSILRWTRAQDKITVSYSGIAMKRKHKHEKEVQPKIGKFEAHTKGFGRKILETQGWKEGQGLGSSVTGMAEALENEGQGPKDRRGFG